MLDPKAVREAARELATEAIEHQKTSLKGWGIMADWQSAWRTMDVNFELKQMEVFHRMLKKGKPSSP
jgi:isoleucyl-tRNA synthetase